MPEELTTLTRSDRARNSAAAVPLASVQPTMSVWPEVGHAFGLSRSSTYDAVARGEIPTIKLGRLLRAPTAAIRKMLQLDEPGAI